MTEPTPMSPRLLVAITLMVAAWSTIAIPAPSTNGARTTADEPQYLLSALSLWEDFDLDVTDELRDERYREFHESDLPQQTEPNVDGREMSPHDPLLPVLLAAPVGLAGWVGAKLALSLVAGLLAAVSVWVAVRRFGVPPKIAAPVVLAFSLAAPLSAYGAQVYPELPAALVVMLAAAALTSPHFGSRREEGRMARVFSPRSGWGGARMWVFAGSVVALPWLGVKYVPVAAALALVGAVRLWRTRDMRALGSFLVTCAVAGVIYVVVHRVVYGGWTVYASGDHFVGGEATVIGVDPDYAGRSRRLAGLLVDRGFGLAAWTPLYLLAVFAFGALLHRRPRGWTVLAIPFAAGWLTATFVALTMHGWWWPGRQVVVVLPLAVITVAWWSAQLRWTATRVAIVSAVGAIGVLTWCWVSVEAVTGRLTLIVGFEQTSNPWYTIWRHALPDGRAASSSSDALLLAWIVVLASIGALGWWSMCDRPSPGPHPIDTHGRGGRHRSQDASTRDASTTPTTLVGGRT